MAITKAQLIEELKFAEDDFEIDFGCTVAGTPLKFLRVRPLGDKHTLIELFEDFDGEGN